MSIKKKPIASKKPVKKALPPVTVKAKKKKVLAIPKGYRSITPYLIVADANAAINFYKKVFSAKQTMRMDKPDGKVAHAELKIGDSIIMLEDACPEKGTCTPNSLHGCSASIHLYVKDVDTIVKGAVKAGAILTKPVETMYYGDRSGMLQDPYGHHWCVSTHVERVTPAQQRKRAAALFGKK